MRWVIVIIGLIATAGLLFVSALMNWRFGFTLGKTELDAHIYAGASVAADLFKAILPFAVFYLASKRQFLASFVATFMLLITVVYSLTSAAGFAALNRAQTSDSRGELADRYANLQGRLRQNADRLQKLPDSQPVSVLQANIFNAKDNPRWKATTNCTDATLEASKTYCASYRALVAGLAIAQKRAKLEAVRDTLQLKLDSTPRVTVAADPQAELLAKLSGFDISKVQSGLIVLVTALLEVGSGFGAFVSMACFQAMKPDTVKKQSRGVVTINSVIVDAQKASREHKAILGNTAAPKRSIKALAAAKADLTPQLIKSFAAENIKHVDRAATLPAVDLFESFLKWCKARKIEAPTQTAFGRAMVKLGYHKKKHSGRVIYQGIDLMAA